MSTVLEWRVFAPSPTPANNKGPCILLLHEGHFASGWIYSGLLSDPETDLTAAGYYVFVAAYREAPCGLVKGQTCHDEGTDEGKASGRPQQQTDDVKAFIRAMKADSRCNGKYGVVGGSSGASHAAFTAFDITSNTSTWPFWNKDSDDRPLAAVCLSGAYDFTDRTPECYDAIPADPISSNDFRNKIENYTDTCILFDPTGPIDQWRFSPVAHLPTNFTTSMPFRPLYFINTQYDPMPYHQIIDVQCKLTAAGVSSSLYQVLTIPGSHEHAFQYWESPSGQGVGTRVSVGAINFLNSYLK